MQPVRDLWHQQGSGATAPSHGRSVKKVDAMGTGQVEDRPTVRAKDVATSASHPTTAHGSTPKRRKLIGKARVVLSCYGNGGLETAIAAPSIQELANLIVAHPPVALDHSRDPGGDAKRKGEGQQAGRRKSPEEEQVRSSQVDLEPYGRRSDRACTAPEVGIVSAGAVSHATDAALDGALRRSAERGVASVRAVS